ncbi:Xaa-Pro peptidase family protein [Mesorhizobium sp. INR15]|uniref:M24 family metallopeptidase n=1 Tax=Mesorhizobium sp. INR15 TaxID=2654248 RepID=UPI001896A277|nr:Xaa-Pro peptidase family protein [Mesorhizobium sp. INR15]QPC95506.1 M24 family metallopeptidase [Mesorhizobium sp. INR15]
MSSLMWFSRGEYASRLGRFQRELTGRGLDGLVCYQPETVTWTTGFYTKAYTNYHMAIIPAQGAPTLLCRDVSRYYAEQTFAFDDVHYWSDGQDQDDLALSLIRKRFGPEANLGIEFSSWMVPVQRFRRFSEELPHTRWTDVSDVGPALRIIKSPAEIAYQRRAARAAELAMAAVVKVAAAGRNELSVAAAATAALVEAGSDTPGPGVFSSGERASHLHGGYIDRVLQHGDTIQYEPTPHVHHYNARFMRTIKVGAASAAEIDLARRLIDIQDEALATVAPGVAATVPDAIYRNGILSTGKVERYTNKTFYSLGMIMNPSYAEPLEATASSTWRFAAGMVFHSYLLVGDFGMSETVLVTETGAERLTNYPRELIVAGRG